MADNHLADKTLVVTGAAGGFGLVIGVDRGSFTDELLAHGADFVVSDLGQLVPQPS